jgi:hypothetical protein
VVGVGERAYSPRVSGFDGFFETHLTVDGGASEDRVAEWAVSHGIKFTRILLDRGVTLDQPMLTVYGRDTLDGQFAAATALAGRLGADTGAMVGEL